VGTEEEVRVTKKRQRGRRGEQLKFTESTTMNKTRGRFPKRDVLNLLAFIEMNIINSIVKLSKKRSQEYRTVIGLQCAYDFKGGSALHFRIL
jgi:hypothetical protein